jgi:hypothetical protein
MAPKKKDLTPTPAQVRRMPKQDEFVIQNSEGSSETFKPGDWCASVSIYSSFRQLNFA